MQRWYALSMARYGGLVCWTTSSALGFRSERLNLALTLSEYGLWIGAKWQVPPHQKNLYRTVAPQVRGGASCPFLGNPNDPELT